MSLTYFEQARITICIRVAAITTSIMSFIQAFLYTTSTQEAVLQNFSKILKIDLAVVIAVSNEKYQCARYYNHNDVCSKFESSTTLSGSLVSKWFVLCKRIIVIVNTSNSETHASELRWSLKSVIFLQFPSFDF